MIITIVFLKKTKTKRRKKRKLKTENKEKKKASENENKNVISAKKCAAWKWHANLEFRFIFY